MKNPPFNEARGADLAMQIAPPFDLPGTTLRVMPLRANLAQLQRFCDHYLNIAPKELCYFRACLPFVYLMAVKYGRMAVEHANLGWLSQHEILFGVPIERYRYEGGRYVFQDWAFVSPFIYVDNVLSMTTGRQVYGWEKSIIWLDAETSAWLGAPQHRTRIASISAMVFPRMYAGKRQEPRVLLQLEHTPAAHLLELPPDLEDPLAPWNSLSIAARGSIGLLRDGVNILRGMGLLRRHEALSLGSYAAMARRLGELRLSELSFNTVNLKQFRSEANPANICYQALTTAPMGVTAYNRGGLLGGSNLLAGDPSGGFRVILHRYDTHPIIESLGLEVAREWRGESANVALLEPVFPFWLDVDMRYERGETLACRTWSKAPEPSAAPGPPDEDHRYNTARAGASQQISGPFQFPRTTMRVLPLLADPARLQRFCDEYLNDPLSSHQGPRPLFTAWGSYVYLIVTNFDEMSSSTNNIGLWAERELTFYVPIRWYDGEGEIVRAALIPVFSYANSTTAALTSSEVSGIPTLDVTLKSPPDGWMSSSGVSDNSERELLEMSSTLFPSLGEGQGATERVLLEVREGQCLPWNQGQQWRSVADRWGGVLKSELDRKKAADSEKLGDARALALEILTNDAPINVVTLKQFRDIAEPREACYQSVVQLQQLIESIDDIREIEASLYVRIHEYESQPIVATLGLVSKTTDHGGPARVHNLEPIRPFSMRVALREDLGTTLFRRAGSLEWEDVRAPEAPWAPRLGRGLIKRIDERAPWRLRAETRQWLADARASTPAHAKDFAPLETSRVAEVVAAIEPQMVLESILSREWEMSDGARWARRYEQLRSALATARLNAAPDRPTATQIAVFDERQRALLEARLGLVSDADQLGRLERMSYSWVGLIKSTHEYARLRSTLAGKPRELMWIRRDIWRHIRDVDDLNDEADLYLSEANLSDLDLQHLDLQGLHDACPEERLNLVELLQRIDVPERKRLLEGLSAAGFEPEALDLAVLLEVLESAGYDVTRVNVPRLANVLPMVADASESEPRETSGLGPMRAHFASKLDQAAIMMSKQAQKPPFCVRRGAVAPAEQERVFPLALSWDHAWYDGKGK